MSEAEAEQFEAGAIDLRSLHEAPPDRAIFATMYFGHKAPQTEAMVASLIPEKWLPKPGVTLGARPD